MKKILTAGLLGITLCTSAFSQIGKVGINTNAPAAMLHVMDSSVLFSSPFYENFPQYDAPPPASGAGARMMWYPQRRSLRSGMVTGTQWNQSQTGFYSFASGYNSIANGEVATAIGKEVIAYGYSGVVIGLNNDPILNTPQIYVEPTTPLFIIGNGDNPGNRSNALTVLKNGRIGIGTNTPEARLHVEEESVLFRGPTTLPGTPGPPPVSGAGARMMWYADKAAFRVGLVEGVQWDKDSIGLYSFATGFNTRAKGQYALALGNNSRASGSGSVALGSGNVSTGASSVALGTNSVASGNYATTIGAGTDAIGSHSLAGGYISKAEGSYSIAIGYDVSATGIQAVALGFSTSASGFTSFATGGSTKAKGTNSSCFGSSTTAKGTNTAAFGRQTLANGYASAVIGMYNDSILAAQTSPTSTTPLFIIGNGDHDTTRSNALIVRKDGRMGLGTNTPSSRFHLRNGTGGGLFHAGADMIIEDAGSTFLQFSSPNASEAGLLSGNTSEQIRSAIIFRSDDGIDLRTGGNNTRLRINSTGDLDMMSGEVHRTSTGTANLAPICFGAINSSAGILSGTGNFTVTNPSTGRYDITINGESYTGSNYSTSVSPISSSPRIISCSSSGGNLVVYIFDAAGTAVDNGFQFVVYQQ